MEMWRMRKKWLLKNNELPRVLSIASYSDACKRLQKLPHKNMVILFFHIPT